MRAFIVAQFRRPRGVFGRLAGFLMAHRGSNRTRNEWVVSRLDIAPHHRVLEIGCGPGVALGHAVARASEGHVVGVDHSELMCRVASKRNAEAIEAGRLKIIHGTVDNVVPREVGFDRAFAVNVIQFFESPVDTLRTLRQKMAPGGLLAIALQPRNRGATDEDARIGGERNRALLEEAGFEVVDTATLDLAPAVTCVLSRAPRGG